MSNSAELITLEIEHRPPQDEDRPRMTSTVLTENLARELNQEILNKMKGKLRLSNISSTSPLFQLQVVHHDGKIEKIDPKADSPLLSPGFTNSMRNCPTGSPIHVRLIAEIDIGRFPRIIRMGIHVVGKVVGKKPKVAKFEMKLERLKLESSSFLVT